MPVPYSRSPVFDEVTLPAALRNDHRTKPGTWGLLRVLHGEVRLIFIEPPSDQRVTPASPAVIPPQATHNVIPCGPMSMQVEFYHEHPVQDEGIVVG